MYLLSIIYYCVNLFSFSTLIFSPISKSRIVTLILIITRTLYFMKSCSLKQHSEFLIKIILSSFFYRQLMINNNIMFIIFILCIYVPSIKSTNVSEYSEIIINFFLSIIFLLKTKTTYLCNLIFVFNINTNLIGLDSVRFNLYTSLQYNFIFNATMESNELLFVINHLVQYSYFSMSLNDSSEI